MAVEATTVPIVTHADVGRARPAWITGFVSFDLFVTFVVWAC
jgi:hypothetical protein